jgi:hypothetical protein
VVVIYAESLVAAGVQATKADAAAALLGPVHLPVFVFFDAQRPLSLLDDPTPLAGSVSPAGAPILNIEIGIILGFIADTAGTCSGFHPSSLYTFALIALS